MADANKEAPNMETIPAATDAAQADKAASSTAQASSGAETSTQPATDGTAATPTAEGKTPATNPAPANAAASASASSSASAAAAPTAASASAADEQPTKEEEPQDAAATSTSTAPPQTAIEQFAAQLPALLTDAGHDEMWGVPLTTPASAHVPTAIVLQKFLNANDGVLAAAVQQFTAALAFRKEKQPRALVAKTFSAAKFADLGAVTVYPVKDSAVPEVFTWNLYGNVKGKMDEVFVPLDEFMDYRIALQELGIQQLNLASAIEPISADKDPYKIIQVHDYKSISFLRQNPNVKAASTEVIRKFAVAYPELLKEKYFVNVPAVMGWMYALIKVFIAEKTAKKFHPMANGANLAADLKTSGLDETQLPKEYGGQGGSGDGKMKGVPGLVDALKFE